MAVANFGSASAAILTVDSPIAANSQLAAAQLVDLLIPNASSLVITPGTETMANVGSTATKWLSGDATASAIGTFANGSSVNNLPFSSGVVLTTGRLRGTDDQMNPLSDDYLQGNTGILGGNDHPRTTQDWQSATGQNRRSASLATELGIPTNQTQDSASLSFNFSSPTATSISFQYMFASEEYAEYVNSGNNDAFAFLLKDITANGPVINLAKIGSQRVSVNTINNGVNNLGPATNGSYYSANPDVAPVYNLEFDGMAGGYDAAKLFASSAIIPTHEYRIEIVISDIGGDALGDSAVFIGAGTFVDAPPPSGVPEPSTYVGALALAGLVARRLRRKA